MLGIILNVLGVYDMFCQAAFIDVYTNTIQQAIAPIVSLILLIIGYNLKINKDTIGSLLKLVGVRKMCIRDRYHLIFLILLPIEKQEEIINRSLKVSFYF